MARVAVFWRWMGSLSKSFWIREDFFFRVQIGRSGWQWKFFKACWVDRWPGDDIFFFMNWRAGKLCSRCFLSFTGENGETLACERHHFTKLPSLF
jgi:hypothetical protein